MQDSVSKYLFISLALILVFPSTASSQSRMSGIYVAHGTSFAEMLQLTQTNNGQISGVFTSVELKEPGEIKAEQTTVSGSVDAGQVTLKFGSFIFANTVAGTFNGNSIRLQITDSKGNVSSPVLVRGTAEEFKRYADSLKAQGKGIKFSAELLSRTRQFRETVEQAEKWIADAELHERRIPRIKDSYEQIERQMQTLIAQERQTVDSVTRTQISLNVGQGDLAGEQTDLQVEQIWDLSILSNGANLYQSFVKWDERCGAPEDLLRNGATTQAVQSWETACKSAVVEKQRFIPIFNHISSQRAEVKAIQEAAQSRRKALVEEAQRLE
jgi:hypothetical protein